MATFGIFEDDELFEDGFVDEAAAEEWKDHLNGLPTTGAGAYSVQQLCPRGEPYVRTDPVLPDHGEHGVDDCTGEGPWADGPDVLERIRDGLLR